jgi:hypothetical protein
MAANEAGNNGRSISPSCCAMVGNIDVSYRTSTALTLQSAHPMHTSRFTGFALAFLSTVPFALSSCAVDSSSERDLGHAENDTAIDTVTQAATPFVAGVPIYSVEGRCLHVSPSDGTTNAITRGCSPGITAETYVLEFDRIKTAQG